MIPNKLQKGDTIGVVAPCSKIEEKDFPALEESKKLVESAGYKVIFAKHSLEQTEKIAIPPEKRAEDLKEMFGNPEVKMVMCASGGAISNSIFEYLDYKTIKENPKILCGFSDATSILNIIHEKTGLVTFHGPTFKSLTSWGSDYGWKEIIRILEQEKQEIVKNANYTILQEGKAQGTLIGGNISLFSRLINGRYKIEVQNKILMLEELGLETPPEMLYNYLYNMKQNGVFEQIKGLWLGNYEHESKITLPQVLQEVIGNKAAYPIIHSNHFGHVVEQSVIPIGGKIQINTKEKEIIKREKCVK